MRTDECQAGLIKTMVEKYAENRCWTTLDSLKTEQTQHRRRGSERLRKLDFGPEFVDAFFRDGIGGTEIFIHLRSINANVLPYPVLFATLGPLLKRSGRPA